MFRLIEFSLTEVLILIKHLHTTYSFVIVSYLDASLCFFKNILYATVFNQYYVLLAEFTHHCGNKI